MLHLGDEEMTEDLKNRILERARKEGFQMVSLKSSEPITCSHFQPVGTLLEFTATIEGMWEHLQDVPLRGLIRKIEPCDWPGIEDLLQFSSPTRFSKDSRLSPETVQRHKLRMLQVYAEKHPDSSLVTFTDKNLKPVAGLQVSYFDNKGVRLYEVLVRPEYRKGFIALGLLAQNVRNFMSRGLSKSEVRTHIYEDNTSSIRLFEKLGCRSTGAKDHYYHLWS